MPDKRTGRSLLIYRARLFLERTRNLVKGLWAKILKSGVFAFLKEEQCSGRTARELDTRD